MPPSKIVLMYLRSAIVGKNSLIHTFVDRKFSNDYLAPLGVRIFRKIIELPDVNSLAQLNL